MRQRYIQWVFFFTFPLLFGFSSSRSVEEGNKAYLEKKYDEAVQKYQEALKQKPEEGVIFFNLGNAYFQKKSFEEANQFYTQALFSTQKGLKADSTYSQGNCAYREEKLPQALDLYKKTIEENPGDLDAKYNYELTLEKLKEQQKKEEKKKEEEKQKEQQKQENQPPQSKDQSQEKKPEASKEEQEKSSGQQKESPSEQDQNKSTPEEKKSAQEKNEHQTTPPQEQKKENQSEEKDQKEGDQKDSQSQFEESKNTSTKKQQAPSTQKNEEKKGMKEEEALRILDIVRNERKDLISSLVKEHKTDDKTQGKDW